MSHKFSKTQWQEWKTNPETWWSDHGVTLSPEQQEWLQRQNATNLSYDEFKDRVGRSEKFSGFFDWD